MQTGHGAEAPSLAAAVRRAREWLGDGTWSVPAGVGWLGPLLARLVLAAASFGFVTWASIELHEAAHAVAALLLGHRPRRTGANSVDVVGIGSHPLHALLVRHAGWIVSTLVALCGTYAFLHEHLLPVPPADARSSASTAEQPEQAPAWLLAACGGGWSCELDVLAVVLALWLTALGAICSDLIGVGRFVSTAERFFCGNFGLLLLQQVSASKVEYFLRRMIKVTMMRGAQSAGIVTYMGATAGSVNTTGCRRRCVNGKRTDLAEETLKKMKGVLHAKNIAAPQVFQGHTRFATSSIANLSGTHPHQWTKPSRQTHWRDDDEQAKRCHGFGVRSEECNVETFITHNGDLDFYEFLGTVYSLGEVQTILCAPPPPRTPCPPLPVRVPCTAHRSRSVPHGACAAGARSTTRRCRARSTRCASRGCSTCCARGGCGSRRCGTATSSAG